MSRFCKGVARAVGRRLDCSQLCVGHTQLNLRIRTLMPEPRISKDFVSTLRSEGDRACAILGTAFLDAQLRAMLERHFLADAPEDRNAWGSESCSSRARERLPTTQPL